MSMLVCKTMLGSGTIDARSEYKRLETLLEIASRHRLSLDSLDEQSCHLDHIAFDLWYHKFLDFAETVNSNFIL